MKGNQQIRNLNLGDKPSDMNIQELYKDPEDALNNTKVNIKLEKLHNQDVIKKHQRNKDNNISNSDLQGLTTGQKLNSHRNPSSHKNNSNFDGTKDFRLQKVYKEGLEHLKTIRTSKNQKSLSEVPQMETIPNNTKT